MSMSAGAATTLTCGKAETHDTRPADPVQRDWGAVGNPGPLDCALRLSGDVVDGCGW